MRSSKMLVRVAVTLFLVKLCWSESSPNSVVKRKYPARVYEMFKERQKSKSQKEPGVWSLWSEWSPCSRSCGGGVTQQTRQCVSSQTMKERYAHKHRRRRQEKKSMNHCVGLYKRMHLCNTQECPIVRDFRAEQCASYNNRPYKGKIYIWQPYPTVLPQYECALNCEAVGGGFYARLNETVIDGTSCSNPAKIHGKRASFGALSVCVDGYCQAVDPPWFASRKIRSGPGHKETKRPNPGDMKSKKSVASNGIIGAIEDSEENCAACLNGNCRNISGLYMRPDVPKGYNFIAQIPQGACRILVQQLKPTRNIIALRYSNGTSILNGEWKFSGSNRMVEGGGTKFNYRKQDGTSLETVTSPGPLALPVEIMFFAHQMNPGIKYEYLLPIENSPEQIAPPLVNPLPNEILPEPRRLDIPLNTLNQKDEAKPNPHRRYRNRRRFQWKISGLTPCSKSCGGGTQEPIVICVREHTQTPVLERRCTNIERPNPHPIKCNTQQCAPASWSGRWGPCVGSCKHAAQYYVISCLQHLPSGQTVTLNDDDCSSPKPESHSRPCRMPGCDVDNELSVHADDPDDIRRLYKDWHTGAWTPCSVSCGTGHRSRQITCPSGLCHPEKRPTDSEFCENGPCSESGSPSHWLLTEWSQCSEACGTGNQTRRPFCSKDNCDDEAKPETIRACSSDKDCGGKWFTGPWGSCSDSCSGAAKETREVYCVVKVRGQARISMDMTCPPHKPDTERTCRSSCHPSWYVGEWGACEGNCPSGMQKREVRCLDANGHDSSYCNTDEMPIIKRACTCTRKEDPRDKYQPIHDEPNDRSCVDKIRNCYLAVQARLCKYAYYKTHCCESCRNK